MMWELIRANKRKSFVILCGMFIVLGFLGFLIGGFVEPRTGPYIGVGVSFLIALVLGVVSYFFGEDVITIMSDAKPAVKELHPQLFNVVEEMKIAANLPAMPKIYVTPDLMPNAFAAGKDPENSVIVVTAGLLSRLNRDELQGVIAHEMSHILNRDILFMTICGVILGTIIFISEMFKLFLFCTGGRGSRYSSKRFSSKGGGSLQLVFLVLAIVMVIVAPIFARLLYFAASRKREFLADAEAARLTRYPEGLASALEKISVISTPHFMREKSVSMKVIAPMYIVNPLAEMESEQSIFSTHPPTYRRIQILRSMAGGAGYVDYQKAYEKVVGKKSLIPRSSLIHAQHVEKRKPFDKPKTEKKGIFAVKETGDLIRAMNNFIFLTCACGLKLKIPPDFKKSFIICPRCGRKNEVPVAALAAVSALVGIEKGKKEEKIEKESAKIYKYKRKHPGSWESFKCPCGGIIQLSPIFKGKYIRCPKCNGKVEIDVN